MSSRYSIEGVFNILDNVTPKLNSIGVNGEKVTKGLKGSVLKTEKQLENLGKAAVKVGAKLLAAGTVAIAGWATKGVKDAIEFQEALTKVSTVADTAAVSMDQLSAGLRRVSNETGASVKDLAEMQYAAITAGISTADSVDFVASAFKASKATFTDTSTVIDGLTSVMNAYGLSADQADRIAGQFLITNNLGKTSFEELNSSIGRVLPTAARLGVESDELFASITALTAKAGMDTSKAMRSLQGVLAAVVKPTSEASRVAQSLGIDFSESAIKSKGFIGFIEDIKNKTGGSTELLQKMFGTIDAANAIISLTGEGAADFAAALDAMGDSAGAINRAFDTMVSTPQQRLNIMLNKVKNSGINMGMALLPYVEKLMDRVSQFADKVAEIDFEPTAKSLGGILNFAIGLIETLLKVIGTLWQLRGVIVGLLAVYGTYKLILTAIIVVEKIHQGFLKIKAVAIKGVAVAQKIAAGATKIWAVAQGGLNLSLLACPITWIVIGIMAVIAAVVLLVKNWDWVKEKIAKIWEGIKNIFSAVGNFFKNVWGGIKDAAAKAWEGCKNVANKAWEGIKGAAGKAGGWLKNNWKSVAVGMVNPVAGGLKYLYDNNEKFRGFVDKSFEKMKELGGKIWDLMPEGLQNVLLKVKDLFMAAIDKIKDLWNGIKNFFIGLWDAIKEGPAAVVQYIKDAFFGLFDSIKEKFFGFIDIIKEGWEKVKGFFGGIADGAKNIAGKVGGIFTGGNRATAAVPASPAPAISAISPSVSAATVQHTTPMTPAQQQAIYSRSESTENVNINVRAAQGTQAQINRQPAPASRVQFAYSGAM